MGREENTMNIATTKTLAREMNKRRPDCVEMISREQLTESNYYLSVGLNSSTDRDYDYNTGLYNVIEIIYKSSCYAMPRYLTTEDLTKIFRRAARNSKAVTLEQFAEEFNAEL